MTRFFSAMMICVLTCAFAWAVPNQASLVPVKATHQHAQRHKAHKAGKHHAPKRHRYHTV